MNEELVVLRIVHILAGVVWAGSAIFLAFILEPRLRTLGPEIQGRVMAALAGFVVAILAFASGLGTMMTSNQMMATANGMADRPPTPEEGAKMGRLSARATLLGRTTAVLVVIGVGAMASARFVG